MYKQVIADHLLRASVGIKSEAGLSAPLIQTLINEFAGEQPGIQPVDGLVGFLQVEYIPQHRRGDFLSALDWLSMHAS